MRIGMVPCESNMTRQPAWLLIKSKAEAFSIQLRLPRTKLTIQNLSCSASSPTIKRTKYSDLGCVRTHCEMIALKTITLGHKLSFMISETTWRPSGLSRKLISVTKLTKRAWMVGDLHIKPGHNKKHKNTNTHFATAPCCVQARSATIKLVRATRGRPPPSGAPGDDAPIVAIYRAAITSSPTPSTTCTCFS